MRSEYLAWAFGRQHVQAPCIGRTPEGREQRLGRIEGPSGSLDCLLRHQDGRVVAEDAGPPVRGKADST